MAILASETRGLSKWEQESTSDPPRIDLELTPLGYSSKPL